MKEAEKKLLEMKNTSELMVDLAYSALLYDNRDIAKELVDLEDLVDHLYESIQRLALQSCSESADYDHSLILMKIADSIERIADGALDIADVVLRDIDIHPVMKKGLKESDVSILRVVVEENSYLHGKTLGDANFASESGFWVIAIRRGRDWIYGPDEDTTIDGGDVLFARGPKDSKILPWVKARKRVDK